jgi:hypothetical protein
MGGEGCINAPTNWQERVMADAERSQCMEADRPRQQRVGCLPISCLEGKRPLTVSASPAAAGICPPGWGGAPTRLPWGSCVRLWWPRKRLLGTLGTVRLHGSACRAPQWCWGATPGQKRSAGA